MKTPLGRVLSVYTNSETAVVKSLATANTTSVYRCVTGDWIAPGFALAITARARCGPYTSDVPQKSTWAVFRSCAGGVRSLNVLVTIGRALAFTVISWIPELSTRTIDKDRRSI
jgi:hypothetical protein